jgi:gas vesicle protein
MSENNVNGKDFLIGALVGGIIGSAVALLFAPKSGRELRQDIGEGYQVVVDKTTELAGDLGQRSSQLVDQAKEKGTDLVGKAKDVTNQVIEDVKAWRESKKSIEEDVEVIAD